jgi:hypothetical protein
VPDRSTPPPSDELLAAIGEMRPVRTRVPLRELALLLLVSLAGGGVWLFMKPMRGDLPFLDRAQLAIMIAAWMGGLLLALAAALIPPRGQVLPDARRAGLVAITVVLGLVGVVLISPQAPGHTLIPAPERQLDRALHCLGFTVGIGAVPLVAVTIALGRLALVGAWRLGLAAGAAAGAIGGLTLALLCPYGGGVHLGGGHGGGVMALAIAGAIVVPLAARLRRR